MKYIFFVLVFLAGLIIYYKRPNKLVIFWLSIQPVILPAFVLIYPGGINVETYKSLYFSHSLPMAYLFLFIFLKELFSRNISTISIKYILGPSLCLLLYFLVHHILSHFNFKLLYQDVFFILSYIAPLFLLVVNKKLRVDPNSFSSFLYFIILLQALFSIFNLMGFTVYPVFKEQSGFSSHLICGTFGRYNHMTNYLTTVYLFLSISYFKTKSIPRLHYIVLSLIVFVLVLFSGSRMSLVLFLFIIVMCLLIYRKKYLTLFVPVVLGIFLFFFYSKNYRVISKTEADEGSGIERNINGLLSFIHNSRDVDDSTVALSFYLIKEHFDNPIIGNGYSYLGEKAYYLNEVTTQSTFYSDARISYILVEYGILGFICYSIFFGGLYKTIVKYKTSGDSNGYKIAFAYFIICTLTEGGLFDMSILSILFVFAFQKRTKCNYLVTTHYRNKILT